MWYIHTVKYCSTIKRKKMVHSTIWMILENMLIKESKKKKKNQATEVHIPYDSINIHFPL